jgi:hypothetical protein
MHNASSTSLSVRSNATISPLSASMPIWSLRRERRFAVPCFARAAQLQPRAIDNQVQFVGSISPVGVNRQTGPSPAQRHMIGNRQIDIQHAHD